MSSFPGRRPSLSPSCGSLDWRVQSQESSASGFGIFYLSYREDRKAALVYLPLDRNHGVDYSRQGSEAEGNIILGTQHTTALNDKLLCREANHKIDITAEQP